MNREKKLANNLAVYAVGTVSSHVLSYAMVFVYSHFITPEDMGYYDLILTTVSMLQPLILFQINDGVYRYLLNSGRSDRLSAISTGFRFLCLTIGAAELCFLAFSRIYPVEHAGWIALYSGSTLLYLYFRDAARGLRESKLFAACGILNSFIMLLCEALGLAVFDLGVLSLLVSRCVANAVCVAFLFFAMEETRHAFRRRADKALMKKLLWYSAPLIPNSLCWWALRLGSRYIISTELGVSANGIYAMAARFPAILTAITGIFQLAWQESAITEYDKPGRDAFFSDIFRKYYVLLFSLCICAIPATKIVLCLFASAEYQSAWMYTGFLYLGALFNALCSFLGVGYLISKETGKVFATTGYAAALSVLLNVILIGSIGLQAASIAAFAAYLLLFAIRLRHTKRYFRLTVSWREFGLLAGASLAVIGATAVTESLAVCAVLCGVCAVCAAWLNRDLFLWLLRLRRSAT
jgi:O-antigen/teichoic acid export membrane protein